MLSRLDPRINTIRAQQFASQIKDTNQTLSIEVKKLSLPSRIFKHLTGSKERLKISVKIGKTEVIQFNVKNRSQAERHLHMAHYLNEIAQASAQSEKEVAIKAAQIYVRNNIHKAGERKKLFQLIHASAGSVLHVIKGDEPLQSPEARHLESILIRIKKGERIQDFEKLSLEDLAQLLALEKAPTEEQPANLKKILDELRSLVDKNTNLQNGDIGLTDIDKKNKLDQQELNLIEKVFKKVLHSSFLHAQVFIKGKIHHVVKEYRTNEATIKLQTQCAFLRVHPEELIEENAKLVSALKEKYGVNYQAAIDAKFRNIQEELHEKITDSKKLISGGRFFKVKNSFRHMMKTGLAHWFYPMQKRVSKSTKEFEAAHVRVFGEEPLKKAKYHCTEFVAEVTLASLFELDKQLRSELGGEFAETPIIQFPFSERERIRFLDPTRLITELKKCGAITQVPQNPVLVELLKAEDLEWSDPTLFEGMVSRPSPKINP